MGDCGRFERLVEKYQRVRVSSVFGLTEAMYNMTTTPGDTASSQFDLADHLDRAVLFSPDLTPSIPQGGGRGCAPGGKTLRGMHDPLESVSAYSNACSPLLLNLSDFYYGAGLTKMTNRVREIQNKVAR